MLKAIRYLTGTVDFRFEDGFTEGFINGCRRERLNIYNIVKEGNVICASAPSGLYREICGIAEMNGGRIILLKKKGFGVIAKRLENRLGILFGLLICVFLINFLNGFIWSIDVKGNEKLSKSEIVSFMADNGFHEGVCYKSVDTRRLENLLMSSFEEVGWAHINRSGTRASVEISEATKKPEVYEKKGANLVAKKDGVILKAVVSRGFQRVKKGEAVTKGTILVSGVRPNGRKNEFEFAGGEYIAEVKEDVNITVSAVQKYKGYSEAQEYKSIYFFGLDIPLTFKRNKAKTYDISESTQYLELNGKSLPIGTKTKTVKPYKVCEKELDTLSLKALCKKEYEKYLSDSFSNASIIADNVKISVNEEGASAKGYIICAEDIGEEVIIKY